MKDKRVLVTGASRGIGRDMALGFAQAGATLVLASRNLDDLKVVQKEIEELGGNAIVKSCDIAEVTDISNLTDEINSRIGGIDILINNAGIGGSHKFLNHPDELWHKMIAINLTGVYYITKSFVPGMVEQKWGCIINIASTAAKAGGKYIAAYSAAKHGVLGLTRSLAIELAPYITVNAICPGYVDTPMTAVSLENIIFRTGMTKIEVIAEITKNTVQKRLIQPKEITALALYLASEQGRGVTGQGINVDGGGVMY